MSDVSWSKDHVRDFYTLLLRLKLEVVVVCADSLNPRKMIYKLLTHLDMQSDSKNACHLEKNHMTPQ